MTTESTYIRRSKGRIKAKGSAAYTESFNQGPKWRKPQDEDLWFALLCKSDSGLDTQVSCRNVILPSFICQIFWLHSPRQETACMFLNLDR